MSLFKKAEKKKVPLKIGITGPSGSGKTMSALRLAKGLGYQKVALIDSENGSASLYADRFEFDVLEIKPPYTTEKYIAAIEAATNAGYEVLIIDSLSHAWAGEGGILQQKEQLDARGGNSFTNWGKMTPKQEKLVASILHSPIHIILTMRSKQEYIVETNDKGKQAPRKVGLAPVQREGFEYELTAVLDIAINHEAQASKDRTSLFKDSIFQITEDTGKQLMDWRNSGKDPVIDEPKKEESKPIEKPKEAASGDPNCISEKQRKKLWVITKNANWKEEDLKEFLEEKYGVDSTSKIHWSKYQAICEFIEKNPLPQEVDLDEVLK